jgi:hypothetical protein
MRLHEKGIAAPSYTTLKNNYCLRVANVNHRSAKKDFDVLVNAIIKIGNQIITEGLAIIDIKASVMQISY